MNAKHQDRLTGIFQSVSKSANHMKFSAGGTYSLEGLKAWRNKLRYAVEKCHKLISDIEKHDATQK
jgi:hypothetical protein